MVWIPGGTFEMGSNDHYPDVPKVLKALPPKKAARYLQVENEYRILLKYDLALAVPLVQ
jgi:formylglycine-generating enzyme required for sulfatase activity